MPTVSYAHLIVSCLLLSLPPQTSGLDTDGDGLSDFHELYKYGTDPSRADSDGDGVGDGDWLERSEYTYSVRAVVQAMKPVTVEYLNDDFQDARVLHDGGDFVELEVVLYPFSTVNETIQPDPSWRTTATGQRRWLEPGLTSDWTPSMRADLLAALEQDGIDVERLTDVEVVERVSSWLLAHAKFRDGPLSFLTSFDEEGRPSVPDDLRAAADRGVTLEDDPLEERWKHQISARGMFEAGLRGSCTSTSIYLSGCLRAVGIPTRTILCIPLVDASDERERLLVATRLEHNEVRRIAAAHAQRGIGSWTSHTFNEVWVGGRWRRLNYDRLGQNILDADCLGLMIHIATFHDWADARMAETVGRRHDTRTQRELFGGPNPYSTISLSDRFGVHCTIENPTDTGESVTVGAVLWADDAELPRDIREACRTSGRYGLIARVDGLESQASFANFLDYADPLLWLESPNQPRIRVRFDADYWWYKNGSAYIYLSLEAKSRSDLAAGVDYVVVPRNESHQFTWKGDPVVRR